MIQPKKEKSVATRQDSINILNSSLNFKKKIKDLKYTKGLENKYKLNKREDLYIFDNGKIKINKDVDDDEKLIENTITTKNGDIYLSPKVTRTGGKNTKPETIKSSNYPVLKKINNNQYETTEQSSFLGYNIELPNILMDGRILPQKTNTYNLKGGERNPDYVVFNEYDSIAITPFDMLSDKEKQQRVKQYGMSGIPKSYINNKNIPVANRPIKPKALNSINQLNPEKIVIDNTISSNTKIINKARVPKSYKVQEDEQVPYGLGTNNTDNIRTTNYEVSDPNNIDTRDIKGKRAIIPQYANGGQIDPPVKTKGLTPEQQAEAEADVLWTNNWTANRVINGQRLENLPQIPNTQKVVARSINSKDAGANGEGVKMAEFEPSNNIVSLDPNQYETGKGYLSHEFGHRIQKDIRNRLPKTYESYINKPITSVLPNTGTYESDPEEIHSELMRYRRNNNYKPDQVITPNDISKVQDTSYNFNNISQDDLINLLNTTVDVNKPTSVPVVAYGGSIKSLNSMNMKKKKRILPMYADGGDMSQGLAMAGSVASLVPGIGSAVGVGLNLVSGIMAQKDAERTANTQAELIQQKQLQEDTMALQNYNQVGTAGIQYYAKGGTLPTSATNGIPAIGGDIIPLDNNTELAVGNKHNESDIDGQKGITLFNEDGTPQANVEDQEVIKDGDYVFSDRLKSSNGKTFANRIKDLTMRKVKIQDKAKDSMTNRHTDGYNRMIEGIELQEQQLQEEQEFVKLMEPNNTDMTTQYARGGRIKKYAIGGYLEDPTYPLKPIGYVNPLPSTNVNIPTSYVPTYTNNLSGDYANVSVQEASPMESESGAEVDKFIQNIAPSLIDNVGNAIINSRTPRLPRPQLLKNKSLETTINVNPQLSAINKAVTTGVDGIMGNTSNSNVARANIANLRLRGMEAESNIYGTRDNQERSLRNANTQNEQNISNQNTNTVNEFANRNFMRTNEINSRDSANLANFSSDLSESMTRSELQTNTDETMLLELMDDKTGAKMRAMERNPYFAKNPKLRNALKAEVKRRKAIDNKTTI